METAEDGSRPYYQWRVDDPGYDSDDEYYVRGDPVDYTRHFKVTPSSTFLAQIEPEIGSRSVVVEGGDVVISLSHRKEDTVMMKSAILEQCSPFWRTSLSKRWSQNKTVDDENHKLFELDFTTPADAFLVGKTHATPLSLRKQHFASLIQQAPQVDSGDSLFAPAHALAEDGIRGHSATLTMPEELILAKISAHKIAFAILAGHPLKAWRTSASTGLMLVIHNLIGWIHEYGSFKRMGGRVAQYILDKDLCERYPITFLRIACILKSKDLYEEAMAAAVPFYHDLREQSRSYHCLDTGRNAETLIISALGRDHRLAQYIFAQHTHWIKFFRDVEAVMEERVDYHRYFNTDRLRKINDLGREIFRHWWRYNEAQARWGYYETTYHALVRGKIDVASVVGHWKARNKHNARQLPHNIKICDILANTKAQFAAAASEAMEMFDEEGAFLGINKYGHWTLKGKHVFVPEHHCPWLDLYDWDSRRFDDDLLVKVTENMALGDCDFEDKRPWPETS